MFCAQIEELEQKLKDQQAGAHESLSVAREEFAQFSSEQDAEKLHWQQEAHSLKALNEVLTRSFEEDLQLQSRRMQQIEDENEGLQTALRMMEGEFNESQTRCNKLKLEKERAEEEVIRRKQDFVQVLVAAEEEHHKGKSMLAHTRTFSHPVSSKRSRSKRNLFCRRKENPTSACDLNECTRPTKRSSWRGRLNLS